MKLFSAPLRAAFFSLALFGIASVATPARAAFLIDPTGGTSLTTFADPDDGALLRSLGGTFSLYGTSVSSLYVNANGFLSVVDGSGLFADRSVAALAGLVGSPVIAPYYDDLYFDPTVSNTIVEKIVAGSYYSVTYTVNGQSDFTAAATAKFQSVLFTGNTTINGTSFLAGDIVFSYGPLTNTVSSSNFSVGIAQNTANATNAFGVTGGQFATNAAFLSNFNLATQGLLFRPGVGGAAYTQSVIPLAATSAAAPEPGTCALLATGMLPLIGMAARRRKA